MSDSRYLTEPRPDHFHFYPFSTNILNDWRVIFFYIQIQKFRGPIYCSKSGFLFSLCVSLLCMHNHIILHNIPNAKDMELANFHLHLNSKTRYNFYTPTPNRVNFKCSTSWTASSLMKLHKLETSSLSAYVVHHIITFLPHIPNIQSYRF